MTKRLAPYLLILPFLLIMGLIFIGGISWALLQSFGYLPVFGMDEFSLAHYRAVLHHPRFFGSLRFTFYLAAVSSALSVVLGVAIAFLVNKIRYGSKLSYALYKVPIVIPHLVVVILMFHLFFQTGVVSRIMFALGFISSPNDFPLIIYDHRGIGIILVYLYKQIPFVTLTAFTVLLKLNRQYAHIAENLGASPFQILTRVTLPQLAPAILSAFLITFAFAFGAFEVPFLLGSPARITLPQLAHFDYTSPVLAQRPAAMAMNVIISLFSLLLIWLYMKLFEFLGRRGLEGGGL